MAIRLLSIVVLLVLFVSTASAQQIYKWKDGKGQWHYSNTPPSAVETSKVPSSSSLLPQKIKQPSGGQGDLLRAKKLSDNLRAALKAQTLYFSNLGNSTAASKRMATIPSDMMDEIERYRADMRSLSSGADDEVTRRDFLSLMNDTVVEGEASVQNVKSRGAAFFRNQCLTHADLDYSEAFATRCYRDYHRYNCSLPTTVVLVLEDRHRDARQECWRSYPE